MLDYQVPHSLLHPINPLYVVSPRVFGCTFFVHDLSLYHDKMSARTIKYVFLGYSRIQMDVSVTLLLHIASTCL